MKKILIIAESSKPHNGWGRYTKDLTHALKEAGVHVECYYIDGPLRVKKHFLFGWMEAFMLYLKYRREGIELIHSTVEAYAHIANITSFLLKVPYVLTLHGTYSIIYLDHPLFKFFQRRAYKNAKALIAVSSYTRKRVLDYGHFNNLHVIPNSISLSVKNEPKSLGYEKIILSIGGLKKRKGFHLVIKALALIKEEIAPFKYYIVGAKQDQGYADYLQELIKQHNLERNIEIVGSVTEEVKYKLYEDADLFALTPISEGLRFEGFGLVYLEANAMGIPVVGTADSGAEEAIKNGYNGLLSKALDVSDIASKIREVLLNEGKYRLFSANALGNAKREQWSNNVNKYIEIYQK